NGGVEYGLLAAELGFSDVDESCGASVKGKGVPSGECLSTLIGAIGWVMLAAMCGGNVSVIFATRRGRKRDAPSRRVEMRWMKWLR
ncbi:hypothetical protein Q9189_005477, partial [Teloschistes chrysophthalmus]